MKAAPTLDCRDLARRRLPHFLFEYMDGGSHAEVTLRRNIADLEEIALGQRVLTDVSSLELSTTLFGRSQHLPVALAPIGLAGMNARRGEVQAMLRPAWACDVGVLGRPHRSGNVAPVPGKDTGSEDFFAWMRDNFDPTASWKDLEFTRAHWDGPLIIKGILDKDDAIAAADPGADAILVSSHGGRQLDGVPSTARALPSIAEAVGHRLTVLADGGVGSGLGVLRMLALGADGVLLGRAWVYALAARGEAGVTHMLKLIKAEMRVAMALTGRTSIAEIDASGLVAPR